MDIAWECCSRGDAVINVLTLTGSDNQDFVIYPLIASGVPGRASAPQEGGVKGKELSS